LVGAATEEAERRIRSADVKAMSASLKPTGR
jgi:hypothetical protein